MDKIAKRKTEIKQHQLMDRMDNERYLLIKMPFLLSENLYQEYLLLSKSCGQLKEKHTCPEV